MAFYLNTFVPALLLVSLIRVDAKLIGPYFSTGELLPSFGGRESSYFHAKGTLRFALIRRLSYPVILGAIYSFISSDPALALFGGLMSGFLLVWPAWIAPNPPKGISTRDFSYHVLYLLVLLSAGALTLIGFYFVKAVAHLSDGDPLRYLADNLFVFLATLLLSLVLPAFTSGVAKSLSEKARLRSERHARGNEEEH